MKDDDYYDKGKRNIAVERIRDNMSSRESFPLPTCGQIIEKMNGLRTYFNTQRNKLSSSKASGAGTSSVHKIRWQLYESLSFLQDMVTPRRTFSNMDEVDGSELSDVLMEEAASALKIIAQKNDNPLPPPPKSKSRDEHFGETVSQLMSDIPGGASKDMLQIEIQRLIYQTKHNCNNTHFGYYTDNSRPDMLSSPNSYVPRPEMLSSPNSHVQRTYFRSPPPSSGNNFANNYRSKASFGSPPSSENC